MRWRLNVTGKEFCLRLENAPDAFDMMLSAVKIGPVAFLGIPGEPFSEIGKQIKATEGFEMIIPSCNTNGKEGVGEFIIEEGNFLLK